MYILFFQYLRVGTLFRKSCASSSLKPKNLWPFWDTIPAWENWENYSKKYYCFLQCIFIFFLLGVGMYQHDIKENRLTKTLNDIVTECVSFVGENFFQHFPHVSCQAWRNIFKSSGDKSIHIYLTVYPIWLRVAVEYLVAKNLGSTIEKLHIIGSFLAKSVLAILCLLKICSWNTIRISKYWKFTFQFWPKFLWQPESMLETLRIY